MNKYDISNKYEQVRKSLIHHSLIQINDNERIVIEECKDIILFDENTVKLRLSFGLITINGLDMQMKNYSDRGVIIKGKLHSIGFEENGKEIQE